MNPRVNQNDIFILLSTTTFQTYSRRLERDCEKLVKDKADTLKLRSENVKRVYLYSLAMNNIVKIIFQCVHTWCGRFSCTIRCDT